MMIPVHTENIFEWLQPFTKNKGTIGWINFADPWGRGQYPKTCTAESSRGLFAFLITYPCDLTRHKSKKPSRYAGRLWDVARAGFEPTQSEPKSEVLPLDDRAIVESAAKL